MWLRSGKIRAESAAFFCRVGRRDRSRVVAISSVAQKRQWWVVIGRVEGEGAVSLGSVVVVVDVDVGVGVDIVVVLVPGPLLCGSIIVSGLDVD